MEVVAMIRQPAGGSGNGSRLLDEQIDFNGTQNRRRTYLIDAYGSVTFGEIAAKVGSFAAALASFGVGRGDIVSFQLPNRTEAAVVYFATLRLGAIANPIVPIYREKELAFILAQARPKVLVVPQTFRGIDYPELAHSAGRASGIRPQLVVVDGHDDASTGDRGFRSCLGHPAAPGVAERSPDDLAVLLYTSGTTAAPKGVLHSHATLLFECEAIRRHAELTGRDIILMPSPVTHVTGLLYGIELPMLLGARGVLQETWDARQAVDLVLAHGCTFTAGATPFLHGMVSECRARNIDLAPLQTFLCGGADIPANLIADADRQLAGTVLRAFGLSEMPTATCGSPQDPEKLRWETEGRPMASVSARVRGTDGVAQTVGTGELELRGGELFIGYLDSRLDAAAFTSDGWFRTGDLAEIDGNGHVSIRGRVKDVIVRGGENISAREVEDALHEHPAVRDVAIVGYPDDVMGQRACAFVVPSGDGVDLAELSRHLLAFGIARQKFPERLILVDALPKTPSGKVQKQKLRDAVPGVSPAVAGRQSTAGS